METWNGEELAYFAPSRLIGDFSAYIVTDEKSRDSLEITENPVQAGAAITDHAFLKPSELAMQVFLKQDSEETLQDLYQSFLELQRERIPVSVTTGKRVFENLLLKEIEQTTNYQTENVLALSLVFREIIIQPVNEVVTKSDNNNKHGSSKKRGEISPKKASEEQKSILSRLSGFVLGG